MAAVVGCWRRWLTWAEAVDCCAHAFMLDVSAVVRVASCVASLLSESSVLHANLMPLRTETRSREILDQI